MQDHYVGDIGDYGKYGLLRAVCSQKLTLAVNWYKVIPKKAGKQDDGKYTNYLSMPQIYKEYDPDLFSCLYHIIYKEKDRRIERIEDEKIFQAKYFSKEISNDRLIWHQEALYQTKGTDVVFLDPDNGLETFNMYRTGSATEKHVKWSELKDYFTRGQTVILYQHRPQMTKKETCVENILYFQKSFLKADCVKLLEFPKYTNRFYFIFLQQAHRAAFEKVCSFMTKTWSKNDFCKEIMLIQGN